jgi:hypothetical protein
MRTTTVDTYCSYTADSVLHGTIALTISGLALTNANVHTLQLCQFGNDEELAAAASVAVAGGNATASLVLESAALISALGASPEINAQLYLWDATANLPAWNGHIKVRWGPLPTGYVVTTPGTTACTAAQATAAANAAVTAALGGTTLGDAALLDVGTAAGTVAAGNDSRFHAAVTLSTAADTLLALSTQEIGLDTQAANVVLAGPATGAAAAPTMRALVSADLPTAGVTLAKMADLATDTAIGRVSGTTGVPETFACTAQARTLLARATSALMLGDLLAQGGISAAALPTGAAIVAGQIVRLTAQDSTAKAGQGLYYSPDGSGWVCLRCDTAYAWGNTGATPTFAFIAGCKYILTQDQAITAAAVTMAFDGSCDFVKTGAFAFATPTMSGHTVLQRTASGWTNAAGATIEGCFNHTGTRLFISAVLGV